MARDRDDRDDRDEDEDDRPRRRPRRDDDEDADDRPRKRRAARDDDDYDDRPSKQLGPLDKTFRDTNVVILVLFGLCCAVLGLPLGLVGLLTGKDEKAKANAKLVVIISGVMWAISIVWNILRFTVFAARGV